MAKPYTDTPIPQGVIARAAQRLGFGRQAWSSQPVINITLDPIVTTGWFGPGQPLAPVAPADVAGRILDYPVTHNINYQPKVGEGVDFGTLRNLARYYDGLRVVIEACKDDIAKQDFNIIPRDPKKKPDKRCIDIQTFLEAPDRQHSWDQWVRMLLEDMLVIDAMTVYPRKTKGGELYSLDLMDGALITRVIDYWGRTPDAPQPAYQQILKGLPAVDYSTGELIYFPTNVSTNRVYGYSAVEQIIASVNIAIRRQAYFLQYYTDGNMPDSIISVPKEWTAQQIKEWTKWWNEILDGNTSERRKTRFVPEGFGVIDTKEKALTDKSDEWLMRVICFCLGVSPQPFVAQVNRATAETSKEQSEERGTGNRMQRMRGLMRRILTQCFKAPDLDFRWKEEEEIDPDIKAQINDRKVRAGAMSLDEWRAQDGEDPLPDGLGEVFRIYTAAGATPLAQVDEPPEPPPIPGGPPNPAVAGGKPVPPKPEADAKKYLEKYNDNHDEKGQFASGDGGGGSGDAESAGGASSGGSGGGGIENATENYPKNFKQWTHPGTGEKRIYVNSKKINSDEKLYLTAGKDFQNRESYTANFKPGSSGRPSSTATSFGESNRGHEIAHTIATKELMDHGVTSHRVTFSELWGKAGGGKTSKYLAFYGDDEVDGVLQKRHADRPPNNALHQRLSSSVHTALKMVGESAAAHVREPGAKKAVGDDDIDPATIAATTDLTALGLLNDEFKSALGEAAKSGSQRAMIQVGISDSDLFVLGSENAAEWAALHAAELISDKGDVGMIADSTRDMIREAIARYINEGMTREQVADALGEDYAFGEDRAYLIADTELRTADNNGYLEGAKASGIDLVKQWIMTDDETCDECQENADAGYIDLDEEFPSGDDAPQAHPRCRCALGVVPADQTDD